ncbi:MAG: hypothetical protein WD118_07115, partial [Phycisphaeraceae bacterium]
MQETEPVKSDRKVSHRVLNSARKLEQYIRARGFKTGDRFIQPDEAAGMLGESVTTVQRAMTFLAEKNLLERRPKAGTFIGDVGEIPASPNCVHFLLPEICVDDQRTEQGGSWNLVKGMREAVPDLAVQFNFLPAQMLPAAERIVDRAAAAGSLLGIVLVLPTREMRAHFNSAAIPTVVAGGVEPDLAWLCWYDWDQAQTGRLHAQYLLSRGHTRLATVMRDVWSIGEHHLHDGAGQVLASAGLTFDALRVRSVPNQKAAIDAVAHSLLVSDEPATGFICRTVFQADCITEVARSLGMADRVDVVISNTFDLPDRPKYTHVVP